MMQEFWHKEIKYLEESNLCLERIVQCGNDSDNTTSQELRNNWKWSIKPVDSFSIIEENKEVCNGHMNIAIQNCTTWADH